MTHPDDASTAMSDRRHLLRWGAAAALGAGTLAVAGARPASAANGDPIVMGVITNDAGSTPTVMTSATPAATFAAINSNQSVNGSYAGVKGVAGGGRGVHGESESGTGVFGTVTDIGTGVAGHVASSAIGVAVSAYIANPSNYYPAIQVTTAGTGRAIEASNNSSEPTVAADNAGSGHGVHGQAVDSAAAGVYGDNAGAGVGVRGRSVGGRGAKFSGAKAQLQLVRGGTRPASGSVGDIFFDSAKNLWLCKGGTKWVHLA